MNTLFYIAAAIAVTASARAITHWNAVHALLYLVVSLLAVALDFLLLGAPFAAALEVIVYAGAIMVLFVFVIMMLNLKPETVSRHKHFLRPGVWLGPALLAAVLLGELIYVFAMAPETGAEGTVVSSTAVGLQMFGPYLRGVELASIMLLAGLVGGYHLAPRPANTTAAKGGC